LLGEFSRNDFFNFIVGFATVGAEVYVEVLLRRQVYVEGLDPIAGVSFVLSKVFACFHHFDHNLPDVLLTHLSLMDFFSAAFAVFGTFTSVPDLQVFKIFPFWSRG
jgi:hypothetical protein